MTNAGKTARCWAAVLLLAVAGCAPKVTRFDVLPFRVCEGTPSEVTWDLSGSPELTTAPAVQPLPGQPVRYQATEDTLFTLQARRWPYNPDIAETEVRVHQTPPPVREPIAFTMTCEGDRLFAVLPRPATAWDPKIRLETVSSDGGSRRSPPTRNRIG